MKNLLTLIALMSPALAFASETSIYMCSYWNNAGYGTVLSSFEGVRHQVFVDGEGLDRKARLQILNVAEDAGLTVQSEYFVELQGGNMGAWHLNFTGSDPNTRADYKVTVRLDSTSTDYEKIETVVLARSQIRSPDFRTADYSICFKMKKPLQKKGE